MVNSQWLWCQGGLIFAEIDPHCSIVGWDPITTPKLASRDWHDSVAAEGAVSWNSVIIPVGGRWEAKIGRPFQNSLMQRQISK
jgi:hypothetical protein